MIRSDTYTGKVSHRADTITAEGALAPAVLRQGGLISIIVPAYNESDCIDELARRLSAMFDSEPAYSWECVVVENGSSDDTWDKLLRINKADSRFKVVRLARNFRMDGGLTAGLDFVTGDACVLMTADLQDPPELIPTFLREWERGYDNVYGIVTERHGTGLIRRFNSQATLAGNQTKRDCYD